MKKQILLVNGPNLNLLGTREPEIYGSTTLDDIISRLTKRAQDRGWTLQNFQSNHEGEIIDFIHKEADNADAIIINPAGYTHTSVAIRDCILAKNILAVEVHLTNIYKRESFRHHSFIHDIAEAVIVGMGEWGYYFALDYIISRYE